MVGPASKARTGRRLAADNIRDAIDAQIPLLNTPIEILRRRLGVNRSLAPLPAAKPYQAPRPIRLDRIDDRIVGGTLLPRPANTNNPNSIQ